MELVVLYSDLGVCPFKVYVLLCKSENTDDTSQLLLRTNRHIYGVKNEMPLIVSVSEKSQLKKAFCTFLLWQSFMFHDSNRWGIDEVSSKLS